MFDDLLNIYTHDVKAGGVVFSGNASQRESKTVDERMSWWNDNYDENKITVYRGESEPSLQEHKMNHLERYYPYLINLKHKNEVVNSCILNYINSPMKSEELIKMIIVELVNMLNKKDSDNE